MSASACVAYIGVRYDVAANEIDDLEMRCDKRQIAAKTAGLKSYWGNFGGTSEKHVLFVGTEIAILGVEGIQNIQLSSDRILAIISDTKVRLEAVGLSGLVTLNLEWIEDI